MGGGRREQLATTLADRILGLIRQGAFAEGDHLSAQDLANRLHTSRFPVGGALKLLAEHGALRHERNRGYFVTDATSAAASDFRDPGERVYERIAEDYLRGDLPERVSAVFLRERYGLSSAELANLMSRIVSEGWAHRRAGSGWGFLGVLRTPDALYQTYRVRHAIEPAALLEPTFHMERVELLRLKDREEQIFAGGANTFSSEALYQAGVDFHESIMAASGNLFFLETLRRVNQVRRLLAYRTMTNRKRYFVQARAHLRILAAIEAGDQPGAAAAMREHLSDVESSLRRIEGALHWPPPEPPGTSPENMIA